MNCIVYPDGKVTILNCYRTHNYDTGVNKLFCTPLCDTTIESIEGYNEDCWVRIDDWGCVEYEDYRIHVGDGGMGNEGFIACSDVNGELVWGMFFDMTNPFKAAEVFGRTLIAINEHSTLEAEINLDDITKIKMTYVDPNYRSG